MDNRKIYMVALATLIGVSAVGTTVPLTQPIEAQASTEYTYSAQQQKALKLFNDYRVKCGLNPVKLNPYLTKAAQNHANFLLANGYSTYGHDEKKGLKGYTGIDPTARVKATGYTPPEYNTIVEVASFEDSSTLAVKGLIENAYLHRLVMLSPSLTQVGISDGNITVIDGVQDPDIESEEFMFPYDGMTNVPTYFSDAFEDPNPLRFFDKEESGTIITYNIAQKYDLSEDTTIKLYDPQGNLVPSYYRSNFLDTISTYPKKELKKGTTYTAKVKFYDNNSKKTISREWSFTTEGKAPTPKPSTPVKQKVLGNVTPKWGTKITRYNKDGKRVGSVEYGTSYNVVKVTSTRYYLSDGGYIPKGKNALYYEGVVLSKTKSMTVYNAKGKAVRKYPVETKVKVFSHTTKRYNIGNGKYIKVSKTTKFIKNGKF